MNGYHMTVRDWLGGAAIAVPLALLAWHAGAWLWRKTGHLFPEDSMPITTPTENHDQKKD